MNMKRNILLCWTICLLTVTTAAAQSRAVKGIVRDAATKQPLPYCNVVLLGSSTGTTTDHHGKFTLTSPLPVLEIVASFVGYATDTVSVAEDQSQISIMLQPEMKSLDEVMVVSGTMKEVTRMNSPIPVEIYSPALFMKNPTPSIFEALSMVNGVQPQLNCNVCNTGDIHINGMEGPYTMLLIDGMPIVSSLATVYGLSGIPNSMVKRIEVVKGPASTLYGSEAVGGLINVITREPSTSPMLKADISATSVAEINADVSTRFRMRRAQGLLGINYFSYQNKIDINDDNFTDVTQQNRISVFNKWDIKRKASRLASLAFRYVYEDRWGGELQWERKYRGSDEIYGESIFTNRFEFIGNYQLPVKEKMFLDYSYNHHVQDSWYGATSYQADQHVGFTQWRWNKVIGKHDLLFGVPLRFMYYDDNTIGTMRNGSNSPQRTWLPGIFAQDEWAVTKSVTLLSGLRYDHHNEHGSILSPRLSTKVSVGKNNTIRLSIGNGYRVVNLFTEEHAALTGSRDVIIAEELKPERSWNANLNYATMVEHNGGYISFDATVFYTYFTNKIVGDFDTAPNSIIFDNLRGHAVSKGITLNTEVSFTNSLKIIAGATLMDVYQKEPDDEGKLTKIPQLFAPKVSGTYTVSYTFGNSGYSIDLTGRTNGPMTLPVLADRTVDRRPSKSPWFTQLNLQVTKVFDNGLEIYGGGKNLLNFVPKDPILFAEDPSSPYFDTTYNYAPMQGIKAFLGVRYTIQ
jgi:outer membrane receptor for ferrienterochelin and colicins